MEKSIKVALNSRLLPRNPGATTCRETTLLLWIYSMDFLNPLWFALIAARSVPLRFFIFYILHFRTQIFNQRNVLQILVIMIEDFFEWQWNGLQQCKRLLILTNIFP